MSYKEQIGSLVGTILTADRETKQAALLDLHELLESLTKLGDIANHRTFSRSGLILASHDAASCLLSLDRTVKYWQAVVKTLDQKRKENSGSLHIVYPGTGPFGSLLIPLLCHFQWNNLKVSLIELNDDSAACVSSLISKLELGNDIFVFNQDALRFSPEQEIDVLLMECMLAGLEREGQVPLTLHMGRFLSENGVIIPNEIAIGLQYANYQMEFDSATRIESGYKPADPDETSQLRFVVANLFSLSKKSLGSYRVKEDALEIGNFDIPPAPEELPDLILTTTIFLHDDLTIEEYQDGLTYPVYCTFQNKTSETVPVRVNYRLYDEPGLFITPI